MKREIEHVNLGITAELSPTGYSTIYIHRNGEGNPVNSYSTYPRWNVERKARRTLRFFRFLNAFAKRTMTEVA